MTCRFLLATLLLLFAAWLALVPDAARGCAPAMRDGQRVDVADETALIVWDEANKTEHFIRQATFVGNAYDFGFLVPTPDRPTVESADSEIFAELARITEPKTEHRTETGLNFGCGGTPGASADKGTDLVIPNGVIVLEQKRVGNLDYTILKFRADKTQKPEEAADRILGWLGDNGYAARPELTDWLKVYIANTWIITAFKIAGDPGAEQTPPKGTDNKKGETPKNVGLKATAVRMTFKTERAFFPYREPTDQRDAHARNTPRSLRLFVAARQRMEGTIGESTSWPGKTVWSNSIAEAERGELLSKAKLPAETAQWKWRLTEFEDRSSPRPGTDELYFATAADQGNVAREPRLVVTYENPWWLGPAALIVLVALCGGAVFLIRRWVRGPGEDETAMGKGPKGDSKPQKPRDKDRSADPGRWF